MYLLFEASESEGWDGGKGSHHVLSAIMGQALC